MIVNRLREFFAEHPVGFHMDEVMVGEHELVGNGRPRGRRPFEFAVTWGPRDLAAWLDPRGDRFLTQELSGWITADGLCEKAACRGTLALRYFDDHAITYDFTFTANGRGYRFVGEKVNIRWWNLPFSHTTCFGTIADAKTGRLVSRSVTHFRMRSAPRFLASLRVTRGEAHAA
ncbi:hypothetical protein K8I61_16390 [bacterium]|nr:hypothetical protein [bacterium]